MLLVLFPSMYVNNMAKKAKLELLKFNMSAFSDQTSDSNNCLKWQRFFMSTPNDKISLTFFKLIHLTNKSLLAVSFIGQFLACFFNIFFCLGFSFFIDFFSGDCRLHWKFQVLFSVDLTHVVVSLKNIFQEFQQIKIENA